MKKMNVRRMAVLSSVTTFYVLFLMLSGCENTITFTEEQKETLEALSDELNAVVSGESESTLQDVIEGVVTQLEARADVRYAAQTGEWNISIEFDTGLQATLGGGFVMEEEKDKISNVETRFDSKIDVPRLLYAVQNVLKSGGNPRAVIMLPLQDSSCTKLHTTTGWIESELDSLEVTTKVYSGSEVTLANIFVEMSDPPALFLINTHGAHNTVMIRDYFPLEPLTLKETKYYDSFSFIEPTTCKEGDDCCGSHPGIDLPEGREWLGITAEFFNIFDLRNTILFLNGCRTMDQVANYFFEHDLLDTRPEFKTSFCVVLRNKCAALLGWQKVMPADWAFGFSADYLLNLIEGDTAASAVDNMPSFYSQVYSWESQHWYGIEARSTSINDILIFPEDSSTTLFDDSQSEGEEVGEGETILLPRNVPLEMTWIPGGTFQMGRYAGELDSYSGEDPQHTVTVPGFWLGKYEVTKAQWTAVMGTKPWSGEDGVLDDPDSPAVFVSWDDAKAFITALNVHTVKTFRLPSETEWEYACRAGTTTRFYWGDDLSYTVGNAYCWWIYNAKDVGESYAHVVGLKLPNGFGLYDMSGNVLELCEDDWRLYTDVPTNGSAWIDSPRASLRVLRGGGWHNHGKFCRSAYRGGITPSAAKISATGFRLAR